MNDQIRELIAKFTPKKRVKYRIHDRTEPRQRRHDHFQPLAADCAETVETFKNSQNVEQFKWCETHAKDCNQTANEKAQLSCCTFSKF